MSGEEIARLYRYWRGYRKAIDWELLIIALLFKGRHHKVYQLAGRWTGETYEVRSWLGKEPYAYREIDPTGLHMWHRIRTLATFAAEDIHRIKAGTGYAPATMRVYYSRYNPATDHAVWKFAEERRWQYENGREQERAIYRREED